ncbi:MAG: DNA-binding response regulator [Sphingobacteriia bacterium]|nr:MAG: DNA-binding response regulator [Sphingobacteriia bacterium]
MFFIAHWFIKIALKLIFLPPPPYFMYKYSYFYISPISENNHPPTMTTIAIADDKPHYLYRLEKAVASHKQYKHVFSVQNGCDLLLKLTSASSLPDILLLDIEMPKLDGLLATTYLYYKFPSLKIIAASSHLSKDLVAEVITEGATSFISKHSLEPDSITYKSLYGKRDILKESVDHTLQNKSYIDLQLFNKGEYLQKTKATAYIRHQKYPTLHPTITEFIILNAGELTFTEIGAIMNKGKATIKGYSSQASELFGVKGSDAIKSFCIKHGLVKLPSYYDKYY